MLPARNGGICGSVHGTVPGRLTTKIHAVVDAEGRPARRAPTAGAIFFNRFQQMRGIATRYDRRADNYLAAVKIAALRSWINTL